MKRPYLMVEGRPMDVAGGSNTNAIRGACLAVIGQGVPIIWTESHADSAPWLWLLAQRVAGISLARDRPVYAQRLKPRAREVPEAMLASVPGISVGRARSLLERYESVAGVLAAGPEGWRSVPGIGPKVADSLRQAFL